MKLNRRGFILAATCAGLGGCAASKSWPSAPSRPVASATAIIDTHQHVWDLRRFTLPWVAGAGERLNRSYGVADYVKAAEGLKVTKAVYAEVAVTPEQRQAEAEYVIELCRSKVGPTAAAVIGGNPGSEGFAAYITRFKDNPYVKGVRSPYVRGKLEDQKFLDGVRLLGELGMSFDLLMGSELLAEAVKLVQACPRTQFVLDHCGNPSVKWWEKATEPSVSRRRWEEGIARLASEKNVVCKISGVAESGEDGKVTAQVVAPVVNYCLDRFGEERVMFASNWPVCLKTISFKGWVEVLRDVVSGRGERFGQRLFHGNAARFFKLDA